MQLAPRLVVESIQQCAYRWVNLHGLTCSNPLCYLFRHRIVNVLFVCTQGPSCPDPSEVYVDTKSLRYDRVSIMEKGSPNSLCLKESGKVGVLYVCWNRSFVEIYDFSRKCSAA